MKKRGFTLIELLAVIVVLAIIALIATPIVMNVIKKANMGAAERSADNYLKAVETLIATEKLDGTPLVDGTYTIESDGTIKGNGETYTVEVSGTKPVGGSVVIESGKVVKESTTINYEDYTVKYPNGKAAAVERQKTLTLADCDLEGGTANTIGAKYTCKVDPNKNAYTFYLLSMTETSVDLIMDSNISLGDKKTIEYISYEDFIDPSTGGTDEEWIADYENGNVKYGPITAMKFLMEATKTWTNLDKMIITYGNKTYETYAKMPEFSVFDSLGNFPSPEFLHGSYWMYAGAGFDASRTWASHGDFYEMTLVSDDTKMEMRPVITLAI